jgi:uncharacterized membrane protein YfcA
MLQGWELYLAVFGVGIFASFVGSISGGGGLISIPFMILVGVPPQVAIASNKVGNIGKSFTSLFNYGKAGKVKRSYVLPLALIALAASILGSKLLISLPADIVEKATAILMLAMLPTLLMSTKNAGLAKTTKWKRLVGGVLYFGLGIWQAFFGAGVVIVTYIVMMTFFGMTAIESNATHRIPTLVSNIVSLVLFAGAGIIDWKIGGILFVAMVIGAYIGSSQALKRGEKFVKWFMVADVLLSSIKLLF